MIVTPEAEARFRATLRGRLLELDGLRGVAMLWVLLYHVWFLQPQGWLGRILHIIPNLGMMGLEFFFVMSGFLITGILLRTQDLPEYYRSFYGRRLLRTLPLYVAFLLLFYHVIPNSVHLRWMLHWFEDPFGYQKSELWHWFFLSNLYYARLGEFDSWFLSLTWSLAVEEQFYLTWPFVVALLGRKGLTRFCIGAIIMSTAVRCHMLATGAPVISAYVFTFARLDGIALGCLLAIWADAPDGLSHLMRSRRWLAWVGGIVMAGGVAWTVLTFPVDESGVQASSRFLADRGFLGIGLLGTSLVSGAIVCHAVLGDGRRLFHRLMRSEFLVFVAKHSYAMYLFHAPCHHLVAIFNIAVWHPWRERVLGIPLPTPDRPVLYHLAQVEVLVETIALSSFVSVCLWWLLERHFLALKRFFPYSKERRDIIKDPMPRP